MKRIRIVEFRGEKYREIKGAKMACLYCPYFYYRNFMCELIPSPDKEHRNFRDYCSLEVPNKYIPLKEKEKKLGNKS